MSTAVMATMGALSEVLQGLIPGFSDQNLVLSSTSRDGRLMALLDRNRLLHLCDLPKRRRLWSAQVDLKGIGGLQFGRLDTVVALVRDDCIWGRAYAVPDGQAVL